MSYFKDSERTEAPWVSESHGLFQGPQLWLQDIQQLKEVWMVSPTWHEDVCRCTQKQDQNADGLHDDSPAVNSSDFFQPSGQWKRCPSSSAPLLILALPLDKEGEEIHWLPFLMWSGWLPRPVRRSQPVRGFVHLILCMKALTTPISYFFLFWRYLTSISGTSPPT